MPVPEGGERELRAPRGRRLGPVQGFVLPTLRRCGLFSERVATHFHGFFRENFGDRVFASRIKKTVRFAEAPVKGMSVLKYDPDGMAAQSYRDLAKEVLANGKR